MTSGTLVLPAGRVGREGDAPVGAAAAAARGRGEALALGLREDGVGAVVVRLAPSVHDGVRRGFAGALVDAAERTGVAAYVGDGQQRWPAVHRRDVADLYAAAIGGAPAGTVLHGVAEHGVRMREVAELIGHRFGLPTRSIDAADATTHFGWVGSFVATDSPASSAATRALLGWDPRGPGLVEDMAAGFFSGGAR
ncbi:Rossmann-fold NAD(P)-binding domain-containing protein [Curtobacterium sp. SGAir0471]|uniref:hypothetical protein n=1 Tax=Curtobacterium sp. SGAir0471 TaxID=2070337 RepID=UPI0010F7732D|nr:hypothetical protein [Curtobacterium sp. SGAir0471]